MAVYLSATTGAVSAGDEEHYGDDALGMALGVILEQGANSCTRDLDAAMG
ncbi:esterase family protein, partial [Acinetobacter baumannii]|nr:esterase family protein [Acinetobacter baumannii]